MCHCHYYDYSREISSSSSHYKPNTGPQQHRMFGATRSLLSKLSNKTNKNNKNNTDSEKVCEKAVFDDSSSTATSEVACRRPITSTSAEK